MDEFSDSKTGSKSCYDKIINPVILEDIAYVFIQYGVVIAHFISATHYTIKNTTDSMRNGHYLKLSHI